MFLVLVCFGCKKEEAPSSEQAMRPPVEEKAAPPAAAEKMEKEMAPEEKAMAPEEKAMASEEKTMTPEEKTSLPAVNERIEEEAAETDVVPPETVTFEASMGAVTFDHAGHMGRLDCSACHPTDPPEKIVLDKDKAHALCKGCHQEQGAGPTKCTECHKRS